MGWTNKHTVEIMDGTQNLKQYLEYMHNTCTDFVHLHRLVTIYHYTNTKSHQRNILNVKLANIGGYYCHGVPKTWELSH